MHWNMVMDALASSQFSSSGSLISATAMEYLVTRSRSSTDSVSFLRLVYRI